MNLHLDNKLALVSGSTKGIGHAIARRARTGRRAGDREWPHAEVRRRSAREAARNEVPDAKVEGFAGDLGRARAGAMRSSRSFPAVDMLVNNLGIFDPKPFDEIPDEDWQRFFETNVMSGVRLTRAYLPKMKEKNWGRVVFISSESGVQIPVEMIHYGMTKTAQLALVARACRNVARAPA